MSRLKSARLRDRQLSETWRVEIADYVHDLAWSSDGRFLAAISVSGQVWLCTHPEAALLCLGEHSGGGVSVSWRPGTAEFASIGHDGVVRLWNAESRRLIRELDVGGAWGVRVAWRPQGNHLAVAAGKSLRWYTRDGQIVYGSSEHESTIADIGWNPDGSAVAVAAYFGVTLHIPGKPLRKLEWKGSSLALAWSPTGRCLVTGEQDSSVHLWYVKTGRDSQMSGFAMKVLELSWHHTGDFLATGGSDTVILWDCSGKGPEGRTPKMLEGHSTRITQLAFRHRGDEIASSDADGRVLVWSPLTHSTPFFMQQCDSAVSRLVWSPDDQSFAIGEKSGVITCLGVAC